MARSDVFCKGDQFYCHQLATATEVDERDIMAFRPAHPQGAGLVAYLQRLAFADELAGTMRTYLVRDVETDELVGYFSLKAGLASRNEALEGCRVAFDTVPGIELANFAVNGAYLARHDTVRGCGVTIYWELVRGVVRRAAAIVGVSVIYLFSLPDEKVIANYERYGFSRLPHEQEDMLHSRLKPRYDDKCVFMYTTLR